MDKYLVLVTYGSGKLPKDIQLGKHTLVKDEAKSFTNNLCLEFEKKNKNGLCIR